MLTANQTANFKPVFVTGRLWLGPAPKPEPVPVALSTPVYQSVTKEEQSQFKIRNSWLAHCCFLLCLKLKLQTVGPCELILTLQTIYYCSASLLVNGNRHQRSKLLPENLVSCVHWSALSLPPRVGLTAPSSFSKLVPVVFLFLLVYYLRKHLSLSISDWFWAVSNF